MSFDIIKSNEEYIYMVYPRINLGVLRKCINFYFYPYLKNGSDKYHKNWQGGVPRKDISCYEIRGNLNKPVCVFLHIYENT